MDYVYKAFYKCECGSKAIYLAEYEEQPIKPTVACDDCEGIMERSIEDEVVVNKVNF